MSLIAQSMVLNVEYQWSTGQTKEDALTQGSLSHLLRLLSLHPWIWLCQKLPMVGRECCIPQELSSQILCFMCRTTHWAMLLDGIQTLLV